MNIQIQPNDIEIPKDDPFKYDRLDRKETVETIARLIKNVASPCVFGIDADWGYGKSTFLRMLDRYLTNTGTHVVRFNAWESDFSSDPFTALVTELTESLERYQGEDGHGLNERLISLREKAESVIQTRSSKVVRALFAEIPGFGKALAEVVDGFTEQEADERMVAYSNARASIKQFKLTLTDVTSSLSILSDHQTLVLMIDELDRCRPSFAVDLLEVTKHLFSVKNVIFVVAMNLTEIAHSVRALYGTGFDAEGYLARFFNILFKLPDADRKEFIQETFDSVEIRNYLSRTEDLKGSSELDNLRALIVYYLGDAAVSIRTIAQSIHHLGLVYASLPNDRLVLGNTCAILLILKTFDRSLYYQFLRGHVSDLVVVQQISARLSNDRITNYARQKAFFESYLIACQLERDSSESSRYGSNLTTPLLQQRESTLNDTDPGNDAVLKQEKQHAERVVGQLKNIRSGEWHYEGIFFKESVDRIELLSNELAGQ